MVCDNLRKSTRRRRGDPADNFVAFLNNSRYYKRIEFNALFRRKGIRLLWQAFTASPI